MPSPEVKARCFRCGDTASEPYPTNWTWLQGMQYCAGCRDLLHLSLRTKEQDAQDMKRMADRHKAVSQRHFGRGRVRF